MPRLTLRDFRDSRGPRVLGICNTNFRVMADYVNAAQRRLVFAREAGDEGWWGSWAEVAFNNVSRNTPQITCSREIARVEKFNVCDMPVPLRNQFHEYLDFGNGRMPKQTCFDRWFSCNQEAFTRNNAVTFADQTVSPCYIRVYATNVADTDSAKRVFVQGTDSSGSIIYSEDNGVTVQGQFVTLESPFAQFAIPVSAITGFQKDNTFGDIQIFQVDPTTGVETLLLIMQPGETTSGYRRYYLHNLPANCCSLPATVTTLRVTAIVKLELIPVVVDTDYLLIQNLEAVIEECISLRMSEMDNLNAQKLASVHHTNAIRLLNSEISHYTGKQSPAVNFAPFGSARLERQKIGTLI